MKLNISSDEPYVLNTLQNHLNNMFINQKVEAVINGRKYQGFINEEIIISEQEPYQVLIVKIGDVEEKIPVLSSNKTVIRIMKKLVLLETESHHTLIEIIN